MPPPSVPPPPFPGGPNDAGDGAVPRETPPLRPVQAATVRLMYWTRFFLVGGALLFFAVLPAAAILLGWTFLRGVVAIFGLTALWAMIGSAVVRACWGALRRAMEDERASSPPPSAAPGLFMNRMVWFSSGGFGDDGDQAPGPEAGRPRACAPPSADGENAHWADATVVADDRDANDGK